MEHFESLYPAESRYAEIQKVLSHIKEGNSCQILGVPGVGKSNLLELLTYNKNVRQKHLGDNQKWFHFVLCNMSEVREAEIFDVLKFLFLSLADSLRERGLLDEHEKAHKIFNEHIRHSDELILFQGLKEAIDFLAIEKELTIVFLFDKFHEYIPRLTLQFFNNLAVIRSRAKYRFSSVFSVQRSLEQSCDSSVLASFYEFVEGHIVYLNLMDKPSLNFRISYLEKQLGKNLATEKKEKIINLTGGHGKLTRLCFEIVFETNNYQESTDKIEYFLQRNRIQKALMEIWKVLTPSEQNALISNNQDQKLEYLEHVGIVKMEKITIPLFEEFVNEQKKLYKQDSEKIVFDPLSNDIKKGNTSLSSYLTSLEFKLLKFLIQNSGRVIDREEMINAVWKDSASTEGVTDSAFDQLVFRLRKKIESDPNNPLHLQTIKGRGVKFIC